MLHPQFKIMEINVKNGIRTETIWSKELMFKNDAARIMNFLNKKNAEYADVDNAHYWNVVDKDHNVVLTQRIREIVESRGK